MADDDPNPGQSAASTAGGPVNQELSRLIASQPVPVHTVDIKRKDAMEFKPKTKWNVCCIVMVVIFNENNQVLMVQEAKQSCRGSWYLPAGRLEPNETYEEGAKREVKEETGLTCDLVTLLSFHYGSSIWMRLTFLGKVAGGKLKTLAEKDEESLQAQFYDVDSVLHHKLNLRSGDIISVIDQAVQYRSSLTAVPAHPVVRPVTAAHTLLLHRIVVLVDSGQQAGPLVLAASEGRPHIVTCAIAPREPSLLITVHALLRTALAEKTPCPTIHGVVGVEHNGADNGKDGMCLTTLVSLPSPSGSTPPALRSSDFMWVPVTDQSSVQFLREAVQGRLCKLIEK